MSRSYRLRRTYLVMFLTLIAVIAGWVLVAGNLKLPEIVTAFHSALRRSTGSAQLVSYETLPAGAMDDETCEWVPNGSTVLAAAPLQEGTPNGVSGRSSEEVAPGDVSGKKPVRMIRDRYASYSSVAVDPTNNEVVVTDENLFNVLVYNRLDNTPPAAITEPKRAIGGLKTKIEFQSGVYIDPKNGDIYAVNNDTVDTLVIFSRQAKGDIRPDRELHTPHGTFGIAVDEEQQELLLTVQHDSAVVTFQKTAKDDEAPIRLLQGDHTLLADPHGMALDKKNDLIFVTNHGSVHQVRPGAVAARGRTRESDLRKSNWPLGFSNAIPGSGKNLPPSVTVYPRTASGDTAPLRVIQGPKTQMNWPTGIAFDPRRNELFVANDMGDSILVFNASAGGDVAPIRVLRGPQTRIKNPTGVYVDTNNDELWVANFGNHTATAYKLTAAGDTAPLRVIRSAPVDQPTLSIGNPHPVAYDSKREQLLVPNWVAHPQIAAFARLADGNAKPVRKIEGQKTLLGRTMHSIVYDEIHDEFVVPQQFGQAILTFRGGADGEEVPVRVIQGSLTQLRNPDRLGIDPVHNEIFVPQGNAVLVFPREAKGNVAPIRVLKGPDTELGASALAVDPVHDLLVVGGTVRGRGSRLLIFNRTDQGNVKPKAVIGGPTSGLAHISGPFTVYPPKNEIIVSVRGSSSESNEMSSDECFVGVWSTQDNGDVPPRWTIGGPKGILRMVRGVDLDPKNKSVIVTDKRLNAVLTFYFPEMF